MDAVASPRPKRRGNYVPGPGRPRGSKNASTIALEEALAAAEAKLAELLPDTLDVDAHGLLRTVYRDPTMPLMARIEAARAALRVEKPALQATTVNGDLTVTHGIADRLGAARQRFSQVIDGELVNDAATALATLSHAS